MGQTWWRADVWQSRVYRVYRVMGLDVLSGSGMLDSPVESRWKEAMLYVKAGEAVEDGVR
jgi:hypothetical protein